MGMKNTKGRSRLALFGTLTLALCVAVGLAGGADAAKKKKKKKKSPNRVVVQKTNIPVPDRIAGGPVAFVDVPLVVPKKKFGKKEVANVDVTVQVTGSGIDYLADIEIQVHAPNGRRDNLSIPAFGPFPNQSFGPTTLTANTSNTYCFDSTPPCDSPDEVVVYPSYAGKVRDISLSDFYGSKMKGTWRVRVLDFDDNGTSGVLNLAKLEITGIKPPPK